MNPYYTIYSKDNQLQFRCFEDIDSFDNRFYYANVFYRGERKEDPIYAATKDDLLLHIMKILDIKNNRPIVWKIKMFVGRHWPYLIDQLGVFY